jgi:hypothetical protein
MLEVHQVLEQHLDSHSAKTKVLSIFNRKKNPDKNAGALQLKACFGPFSLNITCIKLLNQCKLSVKSILSVD